MIRILWRSKCLLNAPIHKHFTVAGHMAKLATSLDFWLCNLLTLQIWIEESFSLFRFMKIWDVDNIINSLLYVWNNGLLRAVWRIFFTHYHENLSHILPIAIYPTLSLSTTILYLLYVQCEVNEGRPILNLLLCLPTLVVLCYCFYNTHYVYVDCHDKWAKFAVADND